MHRPATFSTSHLLLACVSTYPLVPRTNSAVTLEHNLVLNLAQWIEQYPAFPQSWVKSSSQWDSLLGFDLGESAVDDAITVEDGPVLVKRDICLATTCKTFVKMWQNVRRLVAWMGGALRRVLWKVCWVALPRKRDFGHGDNRVVSGSAARVQVAREVGV